MCLPILWYDWWEEDVAVLKWCHLNYSDNTRPLRSCVVNVFFFFFHGLHERVTMILFQYFIFCNNLHNDCTVQYNSIQFYFKYLTMVVKCHRGCVKFNYLSCTKLVFCPVLSQEEVRARARQDHTYLDQVLLEVQRLWPPFIGGRRIASQVCPLCFPYYCPCIYLVSKPIYIFNITDFIWPL